MPSSDYTTASTGALKLKGSSITKKTKKKRPKTSETSADPKPETSTPDAESTRPENTTSSSLPNEESEAADSKALARNLEEEDDALRTEVEREFKAQGRPKTEAERRFEEQRRKRLDDRLKREGVKTHKERVEELNRYLSRLSEHHDMPRIGPG